MTSLSPCLEDEPDPRTGNAVLQDLLKVLTIALTAAVCGARTHVDIADSRQTASHLQAIALDFCGRHTADNRKSILQKGPPALIQDQGLNAI